MAINLKSISITAYNNFNKPPLFTLLKKASYSLRFIPKTHTFSSKSSSALNVGCFVTSAMGNIAAVDSTMDAVQRKLMFDDECILVDESDNVVGHDTKYNCHLMENIDAGKALHRAFSVFLFNSKYELLLQQRSATKVTFPLVWTNTCCSHPLYRECELILEDDLGVRNAAQRKLLDEMGIQAEDLPVDQFTPLGRILYKAPSDGKWGEHERKRMSLRDFHNSFAGITSTDTLTGFKLLAASVDVTEAELEVSDTCVGLIDYLLFTVRNVSLNPNPDEVADIKYVNREELKEICRKADTGEDGVKLSPWFRLVVDNFMYKWWDHVENGTLKEAVDMKMIHKLN